MKCLLPLVCVFALVNCKAADSAFHRRSAETSTWTPDPFCPYPSTEIIYYPDPVDCTKYIECFAGVKYIRQCPNGLYWHQQISECDYPKNVDCTQYSTDGTTNTPTETTNIPTETSSWTPDPFCPYPSNDIIYYPDPVDCTKYIECFAGVKFIKECPTGLYWHQEISECDYPENVDCSEYSTSDGTTLTPPDTTSTTTASPWTPDPLCPYPSDVETYFPYPYDCTKYWECFEGNKFLYTCPNGLYWNEIISECDYPENVNCIASTTPEA